MDDYDDLNLYSSKLRNLANLNKENKYKYENSQVKKLKRIATFAATTVSIVCHWSKALQPPPLEQCSQPFIVATKPTLWTKMILFRKQSEPSTKRQPNLIQKDHPIMQFISTRLTTWLHHWKSPDRHWKSTKHYPVKEIL